MRRRAGTGTITRLPSGRYRARFVDEAGNKVSLGTYPDEATAARVLATNREDVTSLQSGGLTLREYGAAWLDERERAGYRSGRRERNRWHAHIESDPIADLVVAAITPAVIRDWVDRRSRARAQAGNGHRGTPRRRCARQTLTNSLNMLRVCLESAVPGMLRANPARGVRIPRRVEDTKAATRRPWTWFDERELDLLLDTIPTPERYVVQFAAYTGLRRGEQQALPLSHMRVDSPQPHVLVQYGGHGLPTKSGKPRIVPLFPDAIEAWRAWRKAMGKHVRRTGLAFPTTTGVAWRGNRCGWAGWLKASGVQGQEGPRPTWHSLRHTFASRLISGAYGVPVELNEIRALLGHASITTTERYAHLAPSAMWRLADRIRAAALPAQVVPLKTTRRPR